MKSRWVFHKLNSSLPTWASSIFSPSKTQIFQNPFSQASSSVANHGELRSLLSLCGREGHLQLGSSIHASFIKNPEFFDFQSINDNPEALIIWNSLLCVYVKSSDLSDALKLFDELPMKDTISWNTIISGLIRKGCLEMSIQFFNRMRESELYGFDRATLTTLLSGCDRPEDLILIKMIHGLVFLDGFEREIAVGNALITSYFKCESPCLGRKVFDEMLERNVITWTAVISGLAQNELYEDSLKLFVQMQSRLVNPNLLTYLSSLVACSGLQALDKGRQIHGLVLKSGMQSEICVESALMDLYSKCGCLEDAWKIFESAKALDEVSLTIILVGFAQNGFDEEAIQIFVRMRKSGFEIDPNMVSAVLGVFGVGTSLDLGKQIHSLIIKRNFIYNPYVCNGLINMYSKCGDLSESIKVFQLMPQRSSISWNSMIAAFARHGNAPGALQLYNEMRLEGILPTDVTFLSLLHACSHGGLVKKGMEFLDSMVEDYGIIPREEHYACIVDMLGRAGLLNEARKFIEDLPQKPDMLVWQAFLGACSIYGNSEMGKYAADQLFLASPDSPAPYILLANIYSSEGRWKERALTIKRMKDIGVAKEVGVSWIEIEKKVNSFVVADKMHPQAATIYWVLSGLFGLMKDEGYVPDKRYTLSHLEHEEEE